MASQGHYAIILMAINPGAVSALLPGSVSLDNRIVNASTVLDRGMGVWSGHGDSIHHLLLVMRERLGQHNSFVHHRYHPMLRYYCMAKLRDICHWG